MKNRRLLALLLAFCMVFSNLAMGASAIEAGADSVVNANVETESAATESEVSSFANSNLISGETAVTDGAKTLRDEDVLVKSEIKENEGTVTGAWEFSPVADPDVSLLPEEVPACIEELTKAAEMFAADEIVRAFVVMEAAPLAETATSKALASAAAEKQMIEKQNAVINAIERTVLGGKELSVRYQFTYLTNSFSVETEFANLEKIAMLDGVKSVFVMPVYNAIPTDETAEPNTSGAADMTGVAQVWEELGYTGKGMKIAVIDTGLDLDHPSFAAAPELTEDSLTIADIDAVLENLNAYAKRNTISGKTLYRSAKVPYAFNYVDNSMSADHSMDSQGDHGTHVSGIAAANAVEGTSVKGMAPDAQIIVMKVFGASGGAYTDDIVAALEDAMLLGCDVVNASLGSSAGFTSTDSEIDAIYERLATQDIVACISAGNDGTSSYGNMWGTNMNRTDNPDNAAVGQPGTYANVMTVASADNAVVMSNYFTLADGTKIFYQESYQAALGYTTSFLEALNGQELEYAMVGGVGNEADFYDEEGNSLVEGKVAVVSRGEINYGTKVLNAENAGAVACVVYNNVAGDIFSMYMNIGDDTGTTPSTYLPCAMISVEDGAVLAGAETKTLAVVEELGEREDPNGGQMSSFSSWGVAPDLSLEPDITGVGGNVYSCYDGGQYGLMSGTSMSSPQVAGVTALVMERLYELYPDAAAGTVRKMAEALLMSTADPILGDYAETSPRQQGAGLVNAYQATTSETYLMVNGDKPKASMGDSSTGTFRFTFEVYNIGSEAVTYVPYGTLNTELAASGYGEYWMYGIDMPLDGSVTFDKEEITVPAGGSVSVTATVALSEEDKAYFQTAWENGGYVEGFVYLYAFDDEGNVSSELNMPYLGFYGDWTKAPIFDTANWYDNSFWGVNYANGLPEGDEYYNIVWTDLGGSSWVLGFNPYSGAYLDENGNVAYDPAHNVVSPNSDGYLDGVDELYLSLLRNAKTLTLTWTVDGEIMDQETFENNRKTMYQSGYGQVVPWLYSWYGYSIYDFTDKDGNVLPNGTEVLLTVDAKVDYGTGGNHTIEIPFTVDTQAPELLKVQTAEMPNGVDMLAVKVADDVAVASVIVMNPNGTQYYGQAFDYDLSEDGIVYFNISDLGTEFLVAVCDYACNESYYKVSYDEAFDTNLPSVDTTKLYAYRQYDNYIYSDHMYGWVALDKPAEGEDAALEIQTDDYLEYAAINAAEYVDGKIFAVDSVYNLVVMEPGLYNRNHICNLGVNVIDMTFDDSTDTMYVLSKQGNYTYLYSMDLMTGALTKLKSYGYYNYGPYTIADDDNGTIYAFKYNSGVLYTLDTENGYALTAVKTEVDGVESNVVIKNSDGNEAKPNTLQSMTYADGKLYWAYFYNYYNWYLYSDLITIDTETWESYASNYTSWAYTSDYELVQYSPETELVGLIAMTETDYKIPAATGLKDILVSDESLLMTVGESSTITVTAQPWNYDIQSVTWTSSDDSIATVSDGMVRGVGEGKATITVTADGISKTIDVTVVKVEGSFNAYNYYSGDGNWGYMINVDLASMDYYLTAEAPADFLAGDYNGHDGCFYGYTENGQLWRYDVEAGTAAKVGDAIGNYPYDMAYDYTTGLMYAVYIDQTYGVSCLGYVNLNTGALELCYPMEGFYLMTLACDDEGNLYTVDAYSGLFKIYMESGMPMGMDMIMGDLGTLYSLQSMCWDHSNDVLLWAYCEYTSIVWIDPNAEEPYGLMLGDPTESGSLEFVGLYTVPEDIPELPYVAVQELVAEDMIMLAGATKAPNAYVNPSNATVKELQMTSSDESIVKVNADGTLTAVAAGEAVIAVKVEDNGNTYEASFTVTVMVAADEIYGHVVTDVATWGSQYWVRLHAKDPSDPDILNSFPYLIYAEEYYDGKLYAVGYDPNDWSGNWQFFVLDAATYSIEKQVEMADSYPFVYDMTYDYATSTMYAVAGPSDNASDVYMINMETGELTLMLETEQFFMSIAAGADGKIYAMEKSIASSDGFDDMWGTSAEFANAQLYTVDPVKGTVSLVGDTGIKSNMGASMTYDYDTDTLYWTGFYSGTTYVSGLHAVDTETGAAVNLGTIGTSGAQVYGLYILSDEYPAEGTSGLLKVIVTPEQEVMLAGGTTALDLHILPSGLDAEIVWTSSDESVATVDANGVVTAVASGNTVITATVTCGDVTLSDSCSIGVLDADAAFLTWNKTDNAWALISRADGSVTNLTANADEPPVVAIASKSSTIYGIDEEFSLFILNNETYERTTIATLDAAAIATNFLLASGYGEDEIAETLPYCMVQVRDLAYDESEDRLLVLTVVTDDWGWELSGSNTIYGIDIATGAMTQLHRIGEDWSSVMALEADPDGTVYYYSAFMDYYTKVDLDNGVATNIVSGQTQSLYGDYTSSHALFYDETAGMLYHLFTQNGNYYRILSVNPTSAALSIAYSEVGEVDTSEWGSKSGDLFAGLTYVEGVSFEFYCGHEWVEATCTEPKTCSKCGATEGEALGHDVSEYESNNDATCTEDGTKTGTCARCGEEITVVDEGSALGHNYVDNVCTNCGAKKCDLIRIAGDSRFDTAFAVADQMKVEMGVEKFETVIVAYSHNFPDALTGSYLAAVKTAPILLYNESADEQVQEYIAANLVEGGTVYILGGINSIAETLDADLTEAGFTAKRLAGATRFETNLAILEEAGVAADQEILVCTATNYADSLSAAATKLPMLLVGDKLTDAQKAFLEGHTGKVTIIGGENSVAPAIAEALGVAAEDRIAGASRYETSVLVAERYFADPDMALLAYANDFPDGLCGGALAAYLDAPMILISNGNFSYADAYVEDVEAGIILGGISRISDNTARDIFELAADAEIPMA